MKKLKSADIYGIPFDFMKTSSGEVIALYNGNSIGQFNTKSEAVGYIKENIEFIMGNVPRTPKNIEISKRREDRYKKLSQYETNELMAMAQHHTKIDINHLRKSPRSEIIGYIIDEELPYSKRG